MARVFIDTNVLAYAFTSSDTFKEGVSRKLLAELERSGDGVISTQVLQELFSVMTRKHGYPPVVALGILHGLESTFLVDVNRAMIYLAARLCESNKLSFWDSLILSAALSTGCTTLLTEDLNHGQIVEGVRIHNPFA